MYPHLITEVNIYGGTEMERFGLRRHTERTALATLRESAKAAAQHLAADCPQDVPAAPSARLEAVEQGDRRRARGLRQGAVGAGDVLRRARRRAEGAPLPRHGGAGRDCARDHAPAAGAGRAARVPRVSVTPRSLARLRRRARGARARNRATPSRRAALE